MLAKDDTPECSKKVYTQFLRFVNCGMLFEVQKWVKERKPTLRPAGSTRSSSALRKAVKAENHSMVSVLWEFAYQDSDELEHVMSDAFWQNNEPSREIARYLLINNCPLDRWTTSSSLFVTHDENLILVGLSRGIEIGGHEGFAEALGSTGSKWLVGFYRRWEDTYPALKKEAAKALYHAIEQRKMRLIALLRWAKVDPFYFFDADVCDEDLQTYGIRGRTPISALLYYERKMEVIEVLKLNPTEDQWFGLIGEYYGKEDREFQCILQLMPNHQRVLKKHKSDSHEILKNTLRATGYDFYDEQRLAMARGFTYYLVSLGVQALHISLDEVKDLRRALYGVKDDEQLVKMLWYIYEMGDERSRVSMKELFRTGKMIRKVKDHYPWLLYDLGLLNTAGKQRVLENTPRWSLDDFELPEPWKSFSENPEPSKNPKRRGRKPKSVE